MTERNINKTMASELLSGSDEAPTSKTPSRALSPTAPSLPPPSQEFQPGNTLPNQSLPVIPEVQKSKRNRSPKRTVSNQRQSTEAHAGIHGASSSNSKIIQAEDNGMISEDETEFQKCFRITREVIRKNIDNFLQNYEKIWCYTTTIFLVITFSRFVAGLAKIRSDCPKEKDVAVYLLVKACFAFVFWIMLLVLGCKHKLTAAIDNLFVEVYLVVESMFSFIWLIVGTVWTFGFVEEMISECPLYDQEWNQHFINFAIFLTVVDWIAVVVFVMYSCYVQFDKSSVGTDN